MTIQSYIAFGHGGSIQPSYLIATDGLSKTHRSVPYLQLVVFFCVGRQKLLSTPNIIGKFRLCQVRPEGLQHLCCGFHCHGKVLNGLAE